MQIEGKDYFLRRRLNYHSTYNGAQNGGDRIDGRRVEDRQTDQQFNDKLFFYSVLQCRLMSI